MPIAGIAHMERFPRSQELAQRALDRLARPVAAAIQAGRRRGPIKTESRAMSSRVGRG